LSVIHSEPGASAVAACKFPDPNFETASQLRSAFMGTDTIEGWPYRIEEAIFLY
jgi:hypothetical protein